MRSLGPEDRERERLIGAALTLAVLAVLLAVLVGCETERADRPGTLHTAELATLDGWSEPWRTDGVWDAASGGVLRYRGTTQGRHGLAWSEPGTDLRDVEIRATMRFDAQDGKVVVRGGGVAGEESGYTLSIEADSMMLQRFEGGTWTDLARAAFAYRPGEVLHVALEARGDSIRGTWWRPGDPEPEWLLRATDDRLERGWVGVFAFQPAAHEWSDLSVRVADPPRVQPPTAPAPGLGPLPAGVLGGPLRMEVGHRVRMHAEHTPNGLRVGVVPSVWRGTWQDSVAVLEWAPIPADTRWIEVIQASDTLRIPAGYRIRMAALAPGTARVVAVTGAGETHTLGIEDIP